MTDLALLSTIANFPLYPLPGAWMILAIATIYLVGSDRIDHDNNREHAGLVLNWASTFFLSFLYFQYHLHKVSERKEEAQSRIVGPVS